MAQIYTVAFRSPLGQLTVASDGKEVTGLWMEGQRHFPNLGQTADGSGIQAVQQAIAWLDGYFYAAEALPPMPQLSLTGSAFQRKVWAALQDIPYGCTRTYAQIAEAVTGSSGATRAVGNAIGRNPIAILIPCHRVVRAGGNLGGYAGGADRKAFLLALEQGKNK